MRSMEGRYIIFFLLFFLSGNAAVYKQPKIKVKIGKALKKVNISGVDIKGKWGKKKKKHFFEGKQHFNFNCKKVENYTFRKSKKLASLQSLTGVLSWEDKKYRGDLHLLSNHSQENCDLINEVPMEDYISGLLAKEMQASWPKEALKAQAVAARTYALFKQRKSISKKQGFDLENSEFYQVSGTLNDERMSTVVASRKTQGEILINKKGKITPAFFHSKCGGKTIKPHKVWGNKVTGYKEVKCPYCHKHGQQTYTELISKKAMKRVLSRKWKGLKGEIRLAPDNRETQNLRFYIGEKPVIVTKSKLRKLLGRKKIPSHYYQVKSTKNYFSIKGDGKGHGVGLCQYGAFEMAKRGLSYKKILKHYYPDHQIVKLY